MAIRQAISVTRPREWLNTLLTAISARPAGALWATAKLRLLKDRVISLSPTTTVAQLAAHEADYDDYVAGGVTATPPVPVNYNVLGQGWVLSQHFSVTTAAPLVGNDITGYWIDDGTDVVVCEYFPVGQEVPMQVQGDWLDLDLADCVYFTQPV